MSDPANDPQPTLIEELRATTELTRLVPMMVREVCSTAADHIEAVEAERDVLASIVRDLAAAPDNFARFKDGRCMLCEASLSNAWKEHPDDELDHALAPFCRSPAFLVARPA